MSGLTDRIALLLQSEASSEAVAGTLDDARTELAAVNEACADAKARVLDPFSSSPAVTKAKKELEDQTLAASRLEAAIGHLVAQLEAARAREAEAGRKVRYAEAKAARDALAQEILEKYPAAAQTIAELLQQVGVVDQAVMAANGDLPAGAACIPTVDEATQIIGGWPLANSVRLPAIAAVGIPDHIRTHPGQTYLWAAGRQ
jgi:hypothetical protein